MEKHFLGIDVGTGSVRAGIFNRQGDMVSQASHDIKIWHPKPGYAEQSSQDIWRAACRATKQALAESGLAAGDIGGLSFDATCSLVALAQDYEPVSISPGGEPERNIIVWMDHRATEQAARINRTGHKVLDYVGGKISPEMEVPKLLWLKENLPQAWSQARRIMDLTDFMFYRATGQDARSLCSVVCKWTYLAQPGAGGYQPDFFEPLGLSDLFERGLVPLEAHEPGSVPGGISSEAAREMGLAPGTPVAVGLIDAHAGGVGMLGLILDEEPEGTASFAKALALIAGTSSCHMTVSPDPAFVQGIWGPYWGAMVPGMWLNEGGQSAVGSLIDFVIANHGSNGDLLGLARKQEQDPYQALNALVADIKTMQGMEPWRHRHMLPYHHGNRSPRADPLAKGMMMGLTMDGGLEDLALWYAATVQATAYGTRHIIETLNEHWYQIEQVYVCGGHTKNQLFLQEYADITGCAIVVPKQPEAVLLGSAMLGAVAAGAYPSVVEAMKSMCQPGNRISPRTEHRAFHEAKYRVFKDMYDYHCKAVAAMSAV